MSPELSREPSDALEPELTPFDRRVLNALDVWADDREPFGDTPLDWRDIWTIGRRLRSYDLAEIHRVLNGLADLGYIQSRGFDHRKEWVETPWRRKFAKEQSGV